MNKCNRCNKQFKTKYDYERHLKRIKPCKNNNVIDNNHINENDDNYINELDKLKIENEKLKKEIERLLNENKNNINIVNNTNNQNVTINNNNINIIQIVNHGEENYDKINMNEIIEKLNNPPPLERVSSMIYYIHCNDEFPEYQNIYVSDLSRGKMKIYKNGEWRNIETKSTVDALYNKIIEYYDDSNEEDLMEKYKAVNLIIKYKTKLTGSNVFHLIINSENREKTAEILGTDNTNKLSASYIVELLSNYKCNVEEMAKILGKKNIDKINGLDLYNLVYIALSGIHLKRSVGIITKGSESLKNSNEILKALGPKNIAKLSDDNVKYFIDNAKNPEEMGRILGKENFFWKW